MPDSALRCTARMRYPFLTSLLTTLAAAAPAQQEPGIARGRLHAVRVTTGDVFDAATASVRPLAGLVNAIHWQTRTEVVEREIWLQPGELVTAEQAAELERNLRALGLFAEVSVRLVPFGTQGEVDLEVVTRDRLSLFVGGSASYVGGVSGYRVNAGESNLLGYGNRLGASFYENSEGEFRGNLVYTDLHVLDSWHSATVRASRTDEGNGIALDVRRPFKHLADPLGYGLGAHRDETEIDFYRSGDSVAQVTDRGFGIGGDLTWAAGPELRRRYAGFVVAIDAHDYDPATGPSAPEIRVPGDTQSLFLGTQLRFAHIDGYRKVTGLDTIDYVQDLALGRFVGATLGARWRDEDGQDAELQPEANGYATWASEPLTNVFLQLSARGGLRFASGETVGSRGELDGWLYVRTTERNMLGGSATFDTATERQDLPIELTLGEDNGLRGYGARQFVGSSRLRLNLEDRYDTTFELATLRVGAVAFFDAGWVGENDDLGRPYESVGVGLRIGSKPLFGDGLLRIDLARPLDDVDGESDGWKLSVSVGQVFTFGGNASSLPGR